MNWFLKADIDANEIPEDGMVAQRQKVLHTFASIKHRSALFDGSCSGNAVWSKWPIFRSPLIKFIQITTADQFCECKRQQILFAALPEGPACLRKSL